MTRWAKLKRRYRRARCTPRVWRARRELRAHVAAMLRREVG